MRIRFKRVVAAVAPTLALAMLIVQGCDGDDAKAVDAPTIQLMASDGASLPVSCPADPSAPGLAANGVDVGYLRVSTTGWSISESANLAVRVASYDGLLQLQPAGAAGEGGASSGNAQSLSLSASHPVVEVGLRAGLTPGQATVVVDYGVDSGTYCINLASTPVDNISLQFAPNSAAPSGWQSVQVTATLQTKDGNPASLGRTMTWKASDCAYFAAERTTTITDAGAYSNTLYLPAGWTTVQVTVSLDGLADAVTSACLTPAGAATLPVNGSACQANEPIDAHAATDAGNNMMYPCH